MTLVGSCLRKQRYKTETRARDVALRCKAARNVDLRVYWCGSCGGYHLTRERSLVEQHEAEQDMPLVIRATERSIAEHLDRVDAKAARKAARRAAGIQQAVELLRRNGWTVTPPADVTKTAHPAPGTLLVDGS